MSNPRPHQNRIFASVLPVLTFVDEPSETPYECQNRDTRSYDPGACFRYSVQTGDARQRASTPRVSALPLSVSNVLPPLFLALDASGSAVAEPSTSLRLGPTGPCFCACVAALQTFSCIASEPLWPFFSCS